MDKKEIIEKLLKDGAKKFNGVSVKNATITPFEEHVRVTLSVDAELPAFVQNPDTGIYEDKTNNLIFSSTFAIASVLKDLPEAAFAANQTIKNPDSLSVILSGAKLTVISQKVSAGVPYHNPFSTEEDKEHTFENDIYINYIVGIDLSNYAKGMLDRLALAMMGIH